MGADLRRRLATRLQVSVPVTDAVAVESIAAGQQQRVALGAAVDLAGDVHRMIVPPMPASQGAARFQSRRLGDCDVLLSPDQFFDNQQHSENDIFLVKTT
ncbi:hypothetical protein Pstr01_26380 [Pseudomonas straminea]|nr:hypothetical protein Pstr01_26380 [Pseudomonas straminea]